MNFVHPEAFAFGLAVLLALVIRREKPRAIAHPRLAALAKIPTSLRIQIRKVLLPLLGIIALIGITVAAARPQKVTPIERDIDARNILLALDISRSMTATDFGSANGWLTRLEGVKDVVARFIDERKDDRLGLVVFGSQAWVQSPLTRDHALVKTMVERLTTGIAGDGTAIGEGLGVSIKRIADVPSETKAIILLTDGVNNAGQIHPLKAARVARDLKITVHTIGIGGAAQNQGLEFDEVTLKEIASITGGVYFNAADVDGLTEVYRRIDELESTQSEEPKQEIIEELFILPGTIGVIALILYLTLSVSLFMRVP